MHDELNIVGSGDIGSSARRRWRRSVPAIVIGAVLGVSGVARATDPSANTQLAQSMFDEAKKLMAENNFAAACPKLAESQRLDPSGGTILHLAICHEGQGRTATAYAELNEAVSIARRDNRADREAVAKAHLTALAPKLVRLMVTVAPEARIPGLSLNWNGTPLPEAQWGVAFPVDPGDHMVSASAPGRRKWTTHVDVSAQNPATTVAIPALPVEATEPAAAGAATTVPPPGAEHDQHASPSSGGSSQRTVGLVAGGAGVAALVVAGIFEVRALSLAKERDDAAAAGDAATTASKHDAAKSSQLIAAIVGGVGVAALGTGIVLFATAPSRKSMGTGTPALTKSVAIAPLFARSGGGIVVRATGGGRTW